LLTHRCAVPPPSAVPAVAALCLGVFTVVTTALVRPRCWNVLAHASLRCAAAFSCACCGGSLPRRPHCRDYRLGSPALLERPCSRIAALCRRLQLCLLWQLFASASSLSRLPPWFACAAGVSLLTHRCAVPPPSAAPAVAALCLGVLTVDDSRLGSPALLECPCSRIAALCRRLQLGLLWRLSASASSLSVTAALVR
jgi:hypothetical protein